MEALSSAWLLLLLTNACAGVEQFDDEEAAGQQTQALKLGATATASSQENASLSAANAVDGSTTTRWASAFSDPQWIRLDLGAVKQINRVVLRWEAAYSSSYDLEVSTDGATFTKAYTDTAGNGGVDDLTLNASARYLRLNSYKRGTPYGNSLYEFEVYAPDTTPPPTTPPTASALPARLEAEKPARFNDTTPTNLGTASCSSTAVDAQVTTDIGGGCNVGWTVAGEWLEYDVSVAATGKFDLIARLASSTTGKSVHVELDGANVSGALVAPSAGFQSFADVAARGVSITAGAHKLRLVMDTGSTNVNYLDVKAASTTPPPQNLDACKRGVAFGHNTAAGLQALSSKVTWWYNWSPAPETAVKDVYSGLNVEFVPMIWDETRYAGASSIPAGAKTLLGFNEPNFFSQANLSAAQAAAQWPNLQQIAQARGMKLTSPAVNYCGPAASCWDTNPFSYLTAFFAACPGCQVDYIAAHWYACDLPALQSYIGQLKSTFPTKQIWLTEFACGDGSDRSLGKQEQYMQSAIPYLENEPQVAKYAWFADGNAIPNVALTNADGTLSALGQIYAGLAANSACPK